MKKLIAGALALMTIGTTGAFACCGGHGGYRSYNRTYSNRSYCGYYVDANHDGVCDNCHSYRHYNGSHGYHGCRW